MRLGRLLAVASVLASALLLAGNAGAAVWSVPVDFSTIQAAIDSPLVLAGDTIDVSEGQRTGATVTKAVTIRAQGPVTIVDGPVVNALGKAGFLFPGAGAGSGATIDRFSFWDIGYPVFSRGADDVSVTGNITWGALQGVTNWAGGQWGKGWDITGNTILGLRTSCGDGIGILIGDYAGGTVSDNLIAHNAIREGVRVPPDDCGGYNAPGILLFADFRFPGDLGAVIERNRVVKNQVVLFSSEPALVGVEGVELTDTRDDPGLLVIQNNAVIYNDLRGLAVPVALTPAELAGVNRIEMNLTGPLFFATPPTRRARKRMPQSLTGPLVLATPQTWRAPQSTPAQASPAR